MLKVVGLEKSFHDRPVLKGIDLTLEAGELVALLGPSGCGKSTLLRCLIGLEEPDSGTIVRQTAHHTLFQMGMVFQQFNLFEHLSVLGNVCLALQVVKHLKEEVAIAHGKAALLKAGVLELAHFYPKQLSGGQQQRVAIARAIAMDPELLLFDEPTSSLDPERVQEVQQTILQLADQSMTFLIVTHELPFARALAKRILFMEGGKIIVDAPTDIFFNTTTHPSVTRFLEHLK